MSSLRGSLLIDSSLRLVHRQTRRPSLARSFLKGGPRAHRPRRASQIRRSCEVSATKTLLSKVGDPVQPRTPSAQRSQDGPTRPVTSGTAGPGQPACPARPLLPEEAARDCGGPGLKARGIPALKQRPTSLDTHRTERSTLVNYLHPQIEDTPPLDY